MCIPPKPKRASVSPFVFLSHSLCKKKKKKKKADKDSAETTMLYNFREHSVNSIHLLLYQSEKLNLGIGG
jgi:hypothetical protein